MGKILKQRVLSVRMEILEKYVLSVCSSLYTYFYIYIYTYLLRCLKLEGKKDDLGAQFEFQLVRFETKFVPVSFCRSLNKKDVCLTLGGSSTRGTQ